MPMFKRKKTPVADVPAPAFDSEAELEQATQRARALLKRRAMVGAAFSALPLPGVDWLVDAALLSRLLPRINQEFGLTPQQLDALTPDKREQVQKAIALVGSVLIGKLITRDMVVRLARAAGMRMTAKQAARYVPLAGQVAAAGLGYASLRYLGERHIQDCLAVVREAKLDLPGRLRLAARTVDANDQVLSRGYKPPGASNQRF